MRNKSKYQRVLEGSLVKWHKVAGELESVQSATHLHCALCDYNNEHLDSCHSCLLGDKDDVTGKDVSCHDFWDTCSNIALAITSCGNIVRKLESELEREMK